MTSSSSEQSSHAEDWLLGIAEVNSFQFASPRIYSRRVRFNDQFPRVSNMLSRNLIVKNAENFRLKTFCAREPREPFAQTHEYQNSRISELAKKVKQNLAGRNQFFDVYRSIVGPLSCLSLSSPLSRPVSLSLFLSDHSLVAFFLSLAFYVLLKIEFYFRVVNSSHVCIIITSDSLRALNSL